MSIWLGKQYLEQVDNKLQMEIKLAELEIKRKELELKEKLIEAQIEEYNGASMEDNTITIKTIKASEVLNNGL